MSKIITSFKVEFGKDTTITRNPGHKSFHVCYWAYSRRLDYSFVGLKQSHPHLGFIWSPSETVLAKSQVTYGLRRDGMVYGLISIVLQRKSVYTKCLSITSNRVASAISAVVCFTRYVGWGFRFVLCILRRKSQYPSKVAYLILIPQILSVYLQCRTRRYMICYGKTTHIRGDNWCWFTASIFSDEVDLAITLNFSIISSLFLLYQLVLNHFLLQ